MSRITIVLFAVFVTATFPLESVNGMDIKLFNRIFLFKLSRFIPRHFAGTANVCVRFADENDKAMSNKDVPVGRQVFNFCCFMSSSF